MNTGPADDYDDDVPPVHTGGMIRRVPNAPKTPIRGIRFPDELWNALKQAAAEDETDVSTWVRAEMERALKRRERKKEQR